MNRKENTTLGALLKSSYSPQTIQEEMAKNLREKLQKGIPTFEGLINYGSPIDLTATDDLGQPVQIIITD